MIVNLFVIKGVFHAEDIIDKAYKSFYEGETPKVLRTDKNKPYFENNAVYFSLSHSKEYTAVAFCEEEIGIDLQEKRALKNDIAKRYFHPDEQKALKNGFDFYKIWTMKESFVKFTGTGIDENFKSFSVFDLNYFTHSDLIPDHTLCVYTQNPTSLLQWEKGDRVSGG